MRDVQRAPSHIMVNVVDFSELISDAYKHLKEMRAQDGKDMHEYSIGMRMTAKIGYVTTSLGTYVLDEEGVGPEVPMADDESITIHLYEDFEAPPGMARPLSAFPELQGELTIKELKERPVLAREPLHKFIRRFGRRLEENYVTWVQELETAGV